MQLIKMSSKGQFTLPIQVRKLFSSQYVSLTVNSKGVLLQPVEIKHDELKDFSALSEKSFSEVWDNEEDDVYAEFYQS